MFHFSIDQEIISSPTQGAWRVYPLGDVGRALPGRNKVRSMTTRMARTGRDLKQGLEMDLSVSRRHPS